MSGRVDAVVKLGGGLLRQPGRFDAALDALGASARRYRLLIVAGGGPFADAVREVDRQIGLSDDAAHWMAVLAMDQYAHLVASRLPGGAVVTDAGAVAAALDAGSTPVLAPFAWLRATDPLPHAWDVTSDSIAAWVASALGVRRLLLVKPAGAAAADALDPYFPRALAAATAWRIVAADDLDALGGALAPRVEGS